MPIDRTSILTAAYAGGSVSLYNMQRSIWCINAHAGGCESTGAGVRVVAAAELLLTPEHL